MPVQIINAEYTDFNGVTTTFYKSNSGDKITAEINIRSIIEITSINNPLTWNPITNVVTSPTVSWIEEGFRVGNWVKCERLSSIGAVISEWFSTINYVDDQDCDFNYFPSWIATGDIFRVYALDHYGVTPPTVGFNTPRSRDDLDVLVNHSLNDGTGSQFSLIDGEVSRFTFTNVVNMTVGQTIVGNAVGNQSGQFLESVSLYRGADNGDNWNTHKITLEVINSGVYNSSWFDFANCLKLFVKGEWASISGEPFDRTTFILDDSGNTGWLNQANNTSIADSSLIQGIDEIDYCVPSNHTVVVDGIDPDIGIGACYISINDPYYKNKASSQVPITMIVETTNIATTTLNSPLNSLGAGYTIEILSTSVTLSQTTIEILFTPNAQFNTFMAGLDEGDRLFYVWVKCRNINLLAYADQLTCEPPVGGALPMVSDYGFLDHSQNITEIIGSQVGFSADTEDDIAYYGKFRLEYFGLYESFQVRVEAYNLVTEQDFTLQETNFSFAGVQTSGSGQLLLNQTQSIVTILPTTSVKQDALLLLDPTSDLPPTEYGVSIYYPMVLNWRYWLSQANANVDFYPNQNQNWEQYDNIADWVIRIHLSLIKDGLAYTHSNEFIDNPYDNDDNIDSKIDLIREIDSSLVSVIPSGELMRIRSTHIKLPAAWDTLKTWGMLTIEPKESSQRWICSTVVPFDNNTSNPLTPLAGLYIQINYISPDTAVMECYFDSSKIDLTNGVKITAKIKEGCFDLEDTEKITTDNVIKITTLDIDKIIA